MSVIFSELLPGTLEETAVVRLHLAGGAEATSLEVGVLASHVLDILIGGGLVEYGRLLGGEGAERVGAFPLGGHLGGQQVPLGTHVLVARRDVLHTSYDYIQLLIFSLSFITLSL